MDVSQLASAVYNEAMGMGVKWAVVSPSAAGVQAPADARGSLTTDVTDGHGCFFRAAGCAL